MKAVRRKSAARVVRRPTVDKFDERRTELAAGALEALSELGYAKTGLREIAQRTEFSHGVLHYYFADKYELIMFCVKQYKAACVTRYDDVVATAKTAPQLLKGFVAAMTGTLRDDAKLHRLWYDVRSQSLFEPTFHADVAEIDLTLQRMIWRIVTEYAALTKRPLRVDAPFTYAMFDGVFEQALRKHLYGDRDALAMLATQVETLMRDHVLK